MTCILLLALIVVSGCGRATSYRYTMVDYDRSIQESIGLGRYDYCNERVSEENFPTLPNEKGRYEIAFVLYEFDSDVNAKWVVSEMKNMNRRPATIRELITFGGKTCTKQCGPVIALGSTLVVDGVEYLPYVDSDSNQRGLYLIPSKDKWDTHFAFLAVKR